MSAENLDSEAVEVAPEGVISGIELSRFAKSNKILAAMSMGEPPYEGLLVKYDRIVAARHARLGLPGKPVQVAGRIPKRLREASAAIAEAYADRMRQLAEAGAQ